MKRLGLDCVYLDVTHKTREEIEAHFPTVQARCLALGIDMAVERIPVCRRPLHLRRCCRRPVWRNRLARSLRYR